MWWLLLTARAATLTVGPTGTYATVPDAILAAADGDTIAIEAGTYPDPVATGGLSLTFTGTGAADQVVLSGGVVVSGGTVTFGALTLDGAGVGRALDATGATVVLQGTVARGGAGGALVQGGTVLVDGGSFTATDAWLQGGGEAWQGGVLAVLEATLRLDGATRIEAGRATLEGGCVYVHQFPGWYDTTVSGAVTFDGCVAGDDGGGLFAFGTHTLAVDGATFTGSSAGMLGGGLATMWVDTATVTASAFDGNDATAGGALALDSTSDADRATVTASTFTGNLATDAGGGLYAVVHGRLDLVDCAFSANLADGTATVPVPTPDFWGNARDPGEGGAVFSWSPFGALGDLYVTGGTLVDNLATAEGGGLFTAGHYRVTIDGVELSRNLGGDGAGWFATLDSFVDLDGSLVADNVSTGRGGGVYDGAAFSDFATTTFSGNEAQDPFGGGAFATVSGWPDFDDCTFVGNRADEGAAIRAHNIGDLDTASVRFEGNVATVRGSAISVTYSAFDVNLLGDFFCGNTGASETVYVEWGAADVLFADGTVFAANDDDRVLDAEADDVTVRNVHLVGNAGGVDLAGNDVEWVNVLAAWNGGTFSVTPDVRHHDLWWRNDWTLSDLDPTDVLADPLLFDALPGACDPARLRPAPPSPAIDAGDPAILDLDGTVSDIGAYGGEEAWDEPVPPEFQCGGPRLPWYEDLDGDGVGGGAPLFACANPGGRVLVGGDCDDLDGAVGLPGTVWLDQDGDGYGGIAVAECTPPVGVAVGGDCADDDALIGPATRWYPDDDGDGYGAGAPVVQCDAPPGHVLDDTDCDDADPTLHPDTPWYLDADGDGYGSDAVPSVASCAAVAGRVRAAGDCDDGDPALNPDTTWWRDADYDGYGDAAAATVVDCDPGFGWATVTGDCDPADPQEHPGATWYDDADGDGAGDPATEQIACEQPAGAVPYGDDCDDTDPALFPDTEWFRDDDADGYGTGLPVISCDPPPGGWSTLDGDCRDTDALYSPETEWAPDADGDGYGDRDLAVVQCPPVEGAIPDASDCDDADPGLSPDTWWYADLDGDGFGDPQAGLQQCDAPLDHVRDDQDCDDTDATVNPETLWYPDGDGDGWTLDDGAVAACEGPPGTAIGPRGDCDDADPEVYPGAEDVPEDGVDQDCLDGDAPLPDEDEDDAASKAPGGCGCDGGGGRSGLGLLLVALCALRGRRPTV